MADCKRTKHVILGMVLNVLVFHAIDVDMQLDHMLCQNSRIMSDVHILLNVWRIHFIPNLLQGVQASKT